jgi:hypothetical protein
MNPFYGQDPSTLVQALADAREELVSGKSLQASSSGDVTMAFAVRNQVAPPEVRIGWIWAELSRLDPVTYPPGAIARVRVTTARFNDLPK